MDGPGSSPFGSPGYSNIAGGAAGWAENFTEEEDYRDQHNQQVDHFRALMQVYEVHSGNGQSSVTTPEGAKAVEQLNEDGVTVGKQGNPFEAVDKELKALQKSLSQAQNKAQIAKGNAIRDIERIINQRGGAAKNWEKMKGWMPSNNGDHDVEIHWYQNFKDAIGRVEPKSKLW